MLPDTSSSRTWHLPAGGCAVVVVKATTVNAMAVSSFGIKARMVTPSTLLRALGLPKAARRGPTRPADEPPQPHPNRASSPAALTAATFVWVNSGGVLT